MELEGSPAGRGRKRLAVAMGVCGALAAAGSVHATIPDATGTFHACYKVGFGDLRLIDFPAEPCRPDEAYVQWNKVGPTGPAGPMGPVGPAGPRGRRERRAPRVRRDSQRGSGRGRRAPRARPDRVRRGWWRSSSAKRGRRDVRRGRHRRGRASDGKLGPGPLDNVVLNGPRRARNVRGDKRDAARPPRPAAAVRDLLPGEINVRPPTTPARRVLRLHLQQLGRARISGDPDDHGFDLALICP